MKNRVQERGQNRGPQRLYGLVAAMNLTAAHDVDTYILVDEMPEEGGVMEVVRDVSELAANFTSELGKDLLNDEPAQIILAYHLGGVIRIEYRGNRVDITRHHPRVVA